MQITFGTSVTVAYETTKNMLYSPFSKLKDKERSNES